MANWFTNFFSSGIDKVVSSVGDAIDNLVTSDEERLQLRNAFEKEMNELKKSQMDHVENLEKQITDRHSNDMKSDNWLSKSIRPLTLAFMTVATVVFMYATTFMNLSVDQLRALESWQPLLQVLLVTTYSFYFGGRTLEKFKNKVEK
jgi:cation transport ATPase